MKFKLKLAETLNILVPVITFFLGVIITSLIENHKHHVEMTDRAVDETSGLTNDWYNQLYQLNNDNLQKIDSVDFRKAVFFYSQNRLILPKLLKNLVVLKKTSGCQHIVNSTQAFLSLVTNYQKESEKLAISCSDLLLSKHDIILRRQTGQKRLDTILLSLDTLNQQINIEAGDLLK